MPFAVTNPIVEIVLTAQPKINPGTSSITVPNNRVLSTDIVSVTKMDQADGAIFWATAATGQVKINQAVNATVNTQYHLIVVRQKK